MIEFWRAGGSESSTSAAAAQAVETQGWDGQMFMDSQSLSGDPWVMMGAWASATERLQLCTGVTNPLTRHPAVTAACAATVQAISGGRAVLGIGRGDSALAYLGLAPVPLPDFARALGELQSLLGGEEVPFNQGRPDGHSVDNLSLGDRPGSTRLQWLAGDLPKVPLDVAATGPRVIALSARLAERVTFSVGAMPERVHWALETARAARRAQGRDDCDISYGVQIIVVCHPDREAVIDAATSFVAPLARFQVIQGAAAGPRSADDEQNYAAIRREYDMTRHGQPLEHKLGDASLSREFVERFAIVGPPDYCVQRLLELAALGIERFVIVGPGYHPEVRASGAGLFVEEVMPAVRSELAAQY